MPQALAVDATAAAGHNGNGVFELSESAVPIQPTWHNNGASPITLTGSTSLFTGLLGPTYSIPDGSASYGSVAAGGSANCGGNCYSLSLAGTRPTTHWDANMTEVLSNGSFKSWVMHIGGSFTDVPTSHPFYRFTETILHNGITSGCTANTFCPDAAVTRAQMAVFLLVSKLGPLYTPPAATGNIFNDVPANGFAAAWIEDLYNRGIAAGCSTNPPMYCPDASVTRGQMAVFLLASALGTNYTPPAATGIFNDVPQSDIFAAWIEDLFNRGITAGCSANPPLYCPTGANTRGQMSVFLTAAYFLNPLCFVLALPVLGILLGYSLSKRFTATTPESICPVR